jgi:biopolymer transport protein TolR
MAFGRLERSGAPPPMSDINMTPLIDVMLVLMVIFMVSAPLMASRLPLDLPTSGAAQPGQVPHVITVVIDPQGRLHLGDEVLDAGELGRRLLQSARLQPQAEVQLRADKSVPYGRVAELIGLVQQAGLSRIGFVADAPPATASPIP